jgi:hypothetical protein
LKNIQVAKQATQKISDEVSKKAQDCVIETEKVEKEKAEIN